MALNQIFVVYGIDGLHSQHINAQTFGVSSFLKYIITFNKLGCIKLIKSDSKDIYNVRKVLYIK